MIKDNAALVKHVREFLDEFGTNEVGVRVVMVLVSDEGLNVVSDSLNVAEVMPILHAAYIGAASEVGRLMDVPKGDLH